ncbi:hypothetical protein EU546_04540 [Candidatus Thorarchaeota archaeon]|nr:MAG: hypothetical protein EU546_04540 [Candidatus Thorarchaeota archaeon]
MAFEEPQPTPPQYASPLMAFEGLSMLALILQFAAGGVSVYYGVPNALASFGIFAIISIEPLYALFFLAWFGLAIVAWIQLFFGYRMYKKHPSALKGATLINVIAVALYVIDIITTIVILGPVFLIFFPTTLLFFSINLVTVILLQVGSVKEVFAPEEHQTVYGTEYGSSQNW